MASRVDLTHNPYHKTLQKLRHQPRMNLDDVEKLIQRQIQQKTPKDADLFRHGMVETAWSRRCRTSNRHASSNSCIACVL